eukprot:1157802-Pelagomonas_calceolata.AAC.6
MQKQIPAVNKCKSTNGRAQNRRRERNVLAYLFCLEEAHEQSQAEYWLKSNKHRMPVIKQETMGFVSYKPIHVTEQD